MYSPFKLFQDGSEKEDPRNSSLTAWDHCFMTLILLVIGGCVYTTVNHLADKKAKPEMVNEEAVEETSGVNHATESLIAAAGTATFETLYAALPTVTPADDGTIHAYDFGTANLAVTKFESVEDGEGLVVIGCHNDSFEALK